MTKKETIKKVVPFVNHTSFAEASAATLYAPEGAPDMAREKELGHLPDEDTRDLAKRMHYAGCRASLARTQAKRDEWKAVYFALRDRVVLGNRKLAFRAISKHALAQRMADDLVGECDMILLRAVAAYNPWLGVRFSTYAVTCLMRGLARLARRAAAKARMSFLPIETVAAELAGETVMPAAEQCRLADYFRVDHPLLTEREKEVIQRRFGFGPDRKATLQTLGADLGLSKERIRQVQTSALDKLRGALDLQLA